MPADETGLAGTRAAEMQTPHAYSVEAIFARAERVFEHRVDQLLQAKRHKALKAGTPFNARKAKRDARTVAGREKLDALVRRLADLAMVQEAILGDGGREVVTGVLNGAAAAVIGVGALRSEKEQECVADGSSSKDEGEVKDLLDSSSCSDDSVAAALGKEIDGAEAVTEKSGDRHMYQATESVVNFVLDCDDEPERVGVNGRGSHASRELDGYSGQEHVMGCGPNVEVYAAHQAGVQDGAPAGYYVQWSPPYAVPQSAAL